MSNRYETGSPATCSGEEVTCDAAVVDNMVIDIHQNVGAINISERVPKDNPYFKPMRNDLP